MKLSKNLGRIATTFLATAMLASVSAVPAFAEDYLINTATAEVEIVKTITKNKDVLLPNAKFEFSFEEIAGETYNYAENKTIADALKFKEKGQEGIQDDNVIVSAPTANHSEVGETSVVLDDTATIVVDASAFAEPGEYQYKIKEAEGYYEDNTTVDANDAKWGPEELTLTVVITRESDGMRVYSYELTAADSAGKRDGFTNDYMNGGDSGTPVTFTVDKTVTGNAATTAEKTAHYSFNVTITNEATTNEATDKTYRVVVDHHDDGYNVTDGGVYYITENDSETISVAMGDDVTIYGLTVNDKVRVVETGYAGNTQPDGACAWNEFTVSNDYTKTDVADTGEMTVTATSDNNKVSFENNHAITNPTGIVMDVAPYVLLVVIAAAGCFVFLRKRRED